VSCFVVFYGAKEGLGCECICLGLYEEPWGSVVEYGERRSECVWKKMARLMSRAIFTSPYVDESFTASLGAVITSLP
jgi:hypothetical protein